MFKGLRTKIESEQKGQVCEGSTVSKQNIESVTSKELVEVEPSSTGTVQDPFFLNPEQENSTIINDKESVSGDRSFSKTDILSLEPSEAEQQTDTDNEILVQRVVDQEHEILRLQDQLRSVIKDRDENVNQNSQLYQLIEKLRRNLEGEREINSSLQQRFDEAILNIKEKDFMIASLKSKSSTNISMKSYDSVPSSQHEAQSLDNSESLREKVNDLQNQLSEKTRQLKIRHQNINDIKKTLQKEMFDHNKTQDELVKLQNKLKQQAYSNTNDCAFPHNGTIASSDMELKINHSDISDRHQEFASPNLHDGAENYRESATTTPHLDVMSNLSRSSASVEDFDSNDLQQNSLNKEVNLEYLRNVLFRYMTTSDTETSQHLVKALSVMMNFTPEQFATIKSTMYNRSSWLRLK